MEFDITSKHPDYIKWSPIWDLMRDASNGEPAIKAKNEIYLPKKSGIRAIKDRRKQQDAYDAYKFRAEFPDIVAPTIRGTAGLIHSKETTIELPKALEPLKENATADGLTLDQLHRRITSELLRCGRFGLLPGVDDGKFFFARYMTETIINWDEDEGVSNYVVLDETAMVRDPLTNKWEKEESYRECLLDEAGRFMSRIWKKNSDGDLVPGDEDEFATVKGRNALDFMPFVFIGSQDLTASPDEVPLQGLASLATRAYMLDADYANTLHMTSEPTPWVSGVSKDVAPKTIGASSLWVLENDAAKAGMLEFSGPGVDAQERAIANTLQRAVMFGAQLFQDNSRSDESGEAKKIRLNHETSTLKLISASSAQGLEKALKNAAIWAGANPEEVKVEPNMDFVDHDLSPQEITALVAGWMQGAYSKQTLFENLQRGSVIDERTKFDEEEQRIAEDAANVLPDGEGLDLEVTEPDPNQESGNVIQITQALDRLNQTLAS